MKKLIYTTIIFCFSLSAKAQDIHFSQFYEISILRNPALTGIFKGDYKIGAIYRNQWSSISAPFQTALVTAEMRLPVNNVNDFLSFGLIAYYDKAGSANLQTMSGCVAVNYNKSLEDAHHSYISAGFMGGYIQRSFDPGKMSFDEQYQNNIYSTENATGENLPNPQLTQWDLGAGLTYSSSIGEYNNLSYFIGAAGYHLTRPRTNFFSNQQTISQDMKWSINGGLGIRLSDAWRAQLQANYVLQGAYHEIIAGGLLSWNSMDEREQTLFSLDGGVFYRINDALIPTVRLNIHDFTFAVNYDLNISSLKAASNLRGGYEISIFKTGLFNDPKHNQSRTVCPKFY